MPRRVAGATPLLSRFTLKLEPLLDEDRDSIEHPLSRPLRGHVDPEIVDIAGERMAPSIQLVVKIVKHDVGQER
jgi:hypothetical protein